MSKVLPWERGEKRGTVPFLRCWKGCAVMSRQGRNFVQRKNNCEKKEKGIAVKMPPGACLPRAGGSQPGVLTRGRRGGRGTMMLMPEGGWRQKGGREKLYTGSRRK